MEITTFRIPFRTSKHKTYFIASTHLLFSAIMCLAGTGMSLQMKMDENNYRYNNRFVVLFGHATENVVVADI